MLTIVSLATFAADVGYQEREAIQLPTFELSALPAMTYVSVNENTPVISVAVMEYVCKDMVEPVMPILYFEAISANISAKPIARILGLTNIEESKSKAPPKAEYNVFKNYWRQCSYKGKYYSQSCIRQCLFNHSSIRHV